MTESQNVPSTNKQQFYGIFNEPLPPTSNMNFRQPHQSPQMFPMHHQPSNLPSSSSNQATHQKQLQTIVGPSDHYGVHHQYSNDGNGMTDRGGKAPLNLSTSLVKEETKVVCSVDSRTPVIFKIPVAPSKITLADLKQTLPAIDQPNYKYFFKSNDSEFGIVKEEIQDDDSRLPTDRNRVVAWIVTPSRNGFELSSKTRSTTDTCNLTYSNTSYDDGSSSLLTTDFETTSYFTETDDDSLSCSNYSETTCDTFISQRKNRYQNKDNKRSPIQYQSNSPYRYKSQQHERSIRNLDNVSQSSSPTSSSASHSDATAVQCLTVQLVLTNENFLGLHIYANDNNGVDEGIYVDGVTENSAVAQDGRIEPGDKLIQVNDINLEELSNEEAVKVLKDAVMKRGPLKLVVAKVVETNKTDAMDGIAGPKEAIHPIDTAAWVAHAQAITIPNSQDHANSTTSSPSFGSNAQDTDCIRPASAGVTRLSPGLRLNRGTTDIKDIIQHMKMSEIGLDIKDREWLKIQIPMAFLGSELVTWLERNVYGFINNREAKKFASRLLKEGYIRDPISRKPFSSKSYYTFVF